MIRYSKNKIVGAATRWLESERVLKHILECHEMEGTEVSLDDVRRLSTTHYRKLFITLDHRQFTCHVNLSKKFNSSLEEMHRLALSRSVPVATVLGSGTCWKSIIPVRYLLLEWLLGTSFNRGAEMSFNHLTLLGKAFGRLHSITGEDWRIKNISFPRGFRSYATLPKWWLERINNLSVLENSNAERTRKRCLDWMEDHGSFLQSFEQYFLVHGDPNSNNVLVDNDEVRLIDTDQMHFGFSPFELVQCLLAPYNRYDIDRQFAFLAGYEEAVDPHVWQIWNKHMLFIAAYGFLMGANLAYNESLKLANTGKESSRRAKAVRYWNTYKRLIQEFEEHVDDWARIMNVFAEPV